MHSIKIIYHNLQYHVNSSDELYSDCIGETNGEDLHSYLSKIFNGVL